jgi:hypothetical protein
MRSSIVGSVVKPCSPPKKGIAGHERTCHASEIEAGGRFVSFLKIVSACSSCLEILSLHARNEGDQKPEDEAGSVKIRLRADQRSLKQMLLNLSSSLADAAGRVSTSVA